MNAGWRWLAVAVVGPVVGLGLALGALPGRSLGALSGLGAVGPPAASAPLAAPRPGPDSTGVPAGTTLRPSGPITVTRPGTVLDGLEVDGAIEIAADDVTVRRCRILGGGYWGIRVQPGTSGALVEDSEILPAEPSTAMDAIRAEGGFTGRRLEIAGTADGLKAGSGTRLEGSWIHDLATGPDTHNDAVQVLGGVGIALVGNRLEGASNAAVMVSTEFGPVDGLLLQANWLDGGGYTLNLRGGPHGEPRGLTIVDNRFGRGFGYGPAAIDAQAQASGNVWDDTGEALAL